MRMSDRIQVPETDCISRACRFSKSLEMTTSVAYIPMYNSEGENINPDMNTTSFQLICLTCDRLWIGRTKGGITTYTEPELL